MTFADMDYGLTLELVGGIVRENFVRMSIFTDKVPEKDWWQRFLKWWPCTSERKPPHVDAGLLDLHLETIRHCCNCFPELSVGR